MPKGLIEYLAKSLVDKPEAVFIQESTEGPKVVWYIHVDEQDRGKIIGKGGKTIRSIRSVVSVMFPSFNIFIDIAK